jgi:16S rRNA (cytosine967-C5)-methyltransferase
VSSSANEGRAFGLGAREHAARVVARVLGDASYAGPALVAELDRHPHLDDRDRHLAKELVYGVLRTRVRLLRELERHAPRGLAVADARLMGHLLVAAYQLLVLDRIPDFAAVDAAVEGIKRLRGRKLSGFANAVLRKVATSGSRFTVAEGLLETTPSWLLAQLEASVGEVEALAMLGIVGSKEAPRFETPPSAVRVLEDRQLPAWLEQAVRSRWAPTARLVTGLGDVREREGFREGAFVVQEEGAQVLVHLTAARAGEVVLDACAGRGNKALLFAELVGASGKVTATDAYPAKLRALAGQAARLGLEIATQAQDLSVGVAGLEGRFDRVLVDAPCSGVGTLRRRPEILGRLKEADPARIAALSAVILRNAARCAKPCARVFYAVCSVLEQECEAVVASVADVLEPEPFDSVVAASLCPAGASSLRLLPGQHGTDGYFMASLRARP